MGAEGRYTLKLIDRSSHTPTSLTIPPLARARARMRVRCVCVCVRLRLLARSVSLLHSERDTTNLDAFDPQLRIHLKTLSV